MKRVAGQILGMPQFSGELATDGCWGAGFQLCGARGPAGDEAHFHVRPFVAPGAELRPIAPAPTSRFRRAIAAFVNIIRNG